MMVGSADVELFIMSLNREARERYSKRLTLDEIRNWLIINKYEKQYEEYLKPALIYFRDDLDSLAKTLAVDRVIPKGLYIMGIYGGEKKRGKEQYAGLVLDDYSLSEGLFTFKLYNVGARLEVPRSKLDEYGVRVYRVIYVGEINPFRLRRLLPIMLSEKGEEKLKEFIAYVLSSHQSKLRSADIDKLKNLMNEVEQPSIIKPLEPNKWYVVYRCDRVFSALAFKPDGEDIIVESHVSYVETSNKNIAYYYAAVLNYLAYNVMKRRRAFGHHQFARPLEAIYYAGLAWNDVDDNVRKDVVDLSESLHQKAPDKEYPTQKTAIKEISQIDEFNKLVKLLDGVVDKDKFDRALDFVSG